jgi:hypothetical protein
MSEMQAVGFSEFGDPSVLGLRVADVLPAERCGEAHSRLEEGGVRGRLVLEF